MKISINYDLIHKINESKTGMCLQKNFFKNAKVCAIGISLTTLIKLIAQPYEIFEFFSKDFNIFIDFFMLYYGTDTLVNMIFNKKIKYSSDTKLALLSNQLNNELNLNTNIELLKNSKTYKSKYKLTLNRYNIPKITQNKYILVPTYDNLGNIKDTSLLQEHNIGTDEYQLSIGSPNKVLDYKRAYI